MEGDWDKGGDAEAGTIQANAGCTKTSTKFAAAAKARVAGASASYKCFGASAETLSADASVSASWIEGLKAGANAKVAWAEANAGPISGGVGL